MYVLIFRVFFATSKKCVKATPTFKSWLPLANALLEFQSALPPSQRSRQIQTFANCVKYRPIFGILSFGLKPSYKFVAKKHYQKICKWKIYAKVHYIVSLIFMLTIVFTPWMSWFEPTTPPCLKACCEMVKAFAYSLTAHLNKPK